VTCMNTVINVTVRYDHWKHCISSNFSVIPLLPFILEVILILLASFQSAISCFVNIPDILIEVRHSKVRHLSVSSILCY
jgi:hypothetical protein